MSSCGLFTASRFHSSWAALDAAQCRGQILRRSSCAFLFVCAITVAVHSDSVFSINLKTDLGLGGGAGGLFAISQLVTPSIGEKTSFENINAIDRTIVRASSLALDNLSTYGTYATLLAPAITILYEFDIRDQFITYAVMYAEALLFGFGTKDLLKALVSRHRPYTYVGAIPPGESGDYFNSFPSGHTSLAFLSATFLSYTFGSEYPESRWKLPITIGSYTAAATIAAARVLSGNHFITDVIAGAAIGVSWGWLVPAVHPCDASHTHRSRETQWITLGT